MSSQNKQSLSGASNEEVKIYGVVTDFIGNPIEAADVKLLDNHFEVITCTVTDKNGTYALEVNSGLYYALMALRMRDYAKAQYESGGIVDDSSRLEFWGWNIPAFADLQINIRYHRLEVYAVNAFMPQGAMPSYFIYFRPMGLSQIIKTNMLPVNSILEIAPDLSVNDIDVFINNERVDVLEIGKVIENGGEMKLRAYLIQVSLPSKSDKKYDRIQVVVTDPESGDQGEAIYFAKR